MPDAGSDLDDSPQEGLVGRTLAGKWTVERRLGEGGMAVVYAARHRNGRRVALKVLRPELSANPRAVKRFAREGYVANKIEHPGAVAILDDDVTEEGSPFLVLELLEGKTLSEAMGPRDAGSGGQRTVREILEILSRLLDVLGAAHRAGVVHRDVKPSNVFLTIGGELKLLDFGIARLDEGGAGGEVTKSGATLGTPGFMAPEQARGRTNEVDARTDVWAVGAVAFWLLSGRQVHEAGTPNELVIAAATQPAPDLGAFVGEVPAVVCGLVHRALALDPEERFPDAGAMRAAVEEVLGQAPPASLDRPPVRRFTGTAPATVSESSSGAGGSSRGTGGSASVRNGRSPRGWPAALALGALVGGTVAATALLLPGGERAAITPPRPPPQVSGESESPAVPAPLQPAEAPVRPSVEPVPAPSSPLHGAATTAATRATDTPGRRPPAPASRPSRPAPPEAAVGDLLDVRK